jgi:hypothetical protein
MAHTDTTTSIFKSSEFKMTGGVLIVWFLWISYDTYFNWGKDNLFWFSLLTLVLLATFAFCFFFPHTFIVNEERIVYRIGYRKYQMKWNEIGRIEIDKKDYKAVFFSKDGQKRLSVFGLNYFSGLKERITLEATAHNIQMERTGRASYLESKNTQAS